MAPVQTVMWSCSARPPINLIVASKKPGNTPSNQERRRAPRVEVLGHLTGEPITFDAPVTVLDLSTGGFSIETTSPMPAGQPHEFRFSLRDGISVILLARIVHQRAVTRGSAAKYVVGFEFLDGSAKAKASRAALVDRILGGGVKKRPVLA
jgi:PilZ domain